MSVCQLWNVNVIIIIEVGLGIMVTVVFKDILCIMSKVFFKCIIFSCKINMLIIVILLSLLCGLLVTDYVEMCASP